MKKSNSSCLHLDTYLPGIIFIILSTLIINTVISQLLKIEMTSQKEYFITLVVFYSTVIYWFKKLISKEEININLLLKECLLKVNLYKIIILGLMLTVCSAVIFALYLKTINQFFPLIHNKLINILYNNQLDSDPLFFAFNRIIISLVAPVIEEIFFRYILLNQLKVKYGIKRAVIISSIIFAVLHLNIMGGFVFSMLASLLYLKYNNLLVPVILHIINNSICTLSMYLEKINKGVAELLLLKFFPPIFRRILFTVVFMIILYVTYNNWLNLKKDYLE